MSIAGDYDIVTDQGSSLTFHLAYQDNDGNGLTLDAWNARMQVRRSHTDSELLLWVTGSTVDNSTGDAWSTAVTGGGSTGEFNPTPGVGASGEAIIYGVSGDGYIKIGVSSTGATGYTGGILVNVQANTMADIPSGKHWYDLEIYNGTSVHKLIKGRFEVQPEITR